MRRTIHRTIMISFLFWILFITDAYSTVYYLDCNLTSDCKTGNYSKTNRNCTGSDGSAYKALSSLNSILVAGDTVYVRGGTYAAQTYNPANSGTSGSKITITKYQSETPIFSGALQIYLSKSYHVLDGITYSGLTSIGASTIRIWGGTYNEIRNCSFSWADPVHNHYSYINIQTGGDGYNTIYNCTFNQTGDNATADDGTGISIGYGVDAPNDKSHHNIIDSCTILKQGAYGIVIWGGSQYNQVKNCIIDQQDQGLGISINDAGHTGITSHNLVDNNIIRNYATGPHNSKAAVQLYGNNNTIRRNRIYNGGNTAFAIEMMGLANDNLIYNNTIYHGKRGAVALKVGFTGNKFYNNIFYGNMTSASGGYDEGVQISAQWWTQSCANDSGGNLYDYNYIQYGTGTPPLTPKTDWLPVFQCEGSGKYRLSQLYAQLPNLFGSHNIENAAGPKFVSEAEYNFNLASDSPCINAGKVVNDADWGNLSYNGSAPDVGAFESNFDSRSFSSPSPPSPPKNLRVVP